MFTRPIPVPQQFREAARDGNLALLQQFRPIINSIDDLGPSSARTALHWAAHEGHLAVIDYLLKEGADPNKADFEGNTPLHLAARNERYLALSRMLQTNAANCYNPQLGTVTGRKEDINSDVDPLIKNHQGDCALMIAIHALTIKTHNNPSTAPHVHMCATLLYASTKVQLVKKGLMSPNENMVIDTTGEINIFANEEDALAHAQNLINKTLERSQQNHSPRR